MKIALLGYGKMGKVIEEIAISRGHEIVLKKTKTDSFDGLELADVAIDFSIPTAAVENISTAINLNIPVISGTTGWLENYDHIIELCKNKNGSFIYGSNFSLGVNLFFELNNHLAKLMEPFEQYKVSITELHHTQKLDAPSGTAISLANDILSNSKLTNWTLDTPSETDLPITAIRKDNIPGTHHIEYNSIVDSIEIIHTAHNRNGFALGAVIAAEWIVDKKGIFTMKDVLGLNNL